MSPGRLRLTLALLAAASASCTSVVIPETDDGGAGGLLVALPAAGGASADGGAPNGGSASTGETGGEAASGSGGTSPTNPDPACVANMQAPTGEPVVIGSGLVFPSHIALASDDVYVTETGAGAELGSLVRAPKAGGEIERVVTGQDQPRDVVVSGEYVYWANWTAYGTLHRYALADGSTGVVQNLLSSPYEIALYDGSIYITETSAAQIAALRPNGTLDTMPTVLAPLAIGVDDTGSYVTSFVIEGEGYSVLHVDNDGIVNELYTGEFNVSSSLLLDDGYLYLAANWGLGPATIVRGTRDGAPFVKLADVAGPTDSAVVADCFVYFTSHDEGEVARVPLQGGEVQVLASGQVGAKGIAVDDDAIYWVRDDNGTVMRLDK